MITDITPGARNEVIQMACVVANNAVAGSYPASILIGAVAECFMMSDEIALLRRLQIGGAIPATAVSDEIGGALMDVGLIATVMLADGSMLLGLTELGCSFARKLKKVE